MSVATDFFTLLAASAGVGALVADRIYPDTAPQDVERPLIVYDITAVNPTYTIHGALALLETQLRAACYASTRAAAEALADAVTTAVNGSGFELTDRSGGYDPDSLVYNTTLGVIYRS